MSRQIVYLIGQPGSGKTTLVAALTEGIEMVAHAKPFAHIVYGFDQEVVELGARRDGFAGTDALGMSVQPVVLSWLAETPQTLVLAEGDRLANGKFFKAVGELGWPLTVIRLAVSNGVAELRRAERAAALGTPPQNDSWLKGRITKVRTLAREWPTVDLDADQPPAAVLAQLLELELPLIDVLRSQA